MTQAGRLLARMHNIGAMHKADHRIELNPETYGLQNLEFLLSSDLIPPELRQAYESVVKGICQHIAPLFAKVKPQRLHGDCHIGNLLVGRQGMFWVDFDDMVMGPPVQDLWLLIPGRDAYGRAKQEKLLSGYETMRAFPMESLALIEPLRALRYVHFAAWIGKRWHDPAFPRAFPYYGTMKYWQEQLLDLREQHALILDTN
jgi:Ser/Thr protein kinase RdoA (MazF antagonist)